MGLILYILLGLWLVWIVIHLVLMATVRPDFACFTGFRVIIPLRYTQLLELHEYIAVYAHELGHQHRGHVWKNFVCVCVFIHVSPQVRCRQELEADDWAAKIINPLDLASALRKLGPLAPFDVKRVERLEQIKWWVTP